MDERFLKQKHELEQSRQMIGEEMPALYWTMYQGCLNQGFDKEQSLRIVLATVSSQWTPPKQ